MTQGVNSETKKLLSSAAALLTTFAIVSGCAGQSAHPEGMESPRQLTDAQKNRVIEIALNTSEAKARLPKEKAYKTSLGWIAVVWKDLGYSEWWGIDYEWEADPNLGVVSKEAVFYSRVVINLGEPPTWQVMVAVNPVTGKVALVEEYPYRTGPTPPVSR